MLVPVFKKQKNKEINKLSVIKNGAELTKLYLKSDVNLLACVLENFINYQIKILISILLYCVSLPGFTRQCGLKHADIKSQTVQDNDLILILEDEIRGGIGSVMGDRHLKSDENEEKKIIKILIIYLVGL